MGYTTDFSGAFKLNKELTPKLHKQLTEFSQGRHEGEHYPSYYCQWVPSEDRMHIEWDGGEKFYNYSEWLVYLVKRFLEPNGYVLNGEVTWQGEEPGDVGKLIVKDNVVSSATVSALTFDMAQVVDYEVSEEEELEEEADEDAVEEEGDIVEVLLDNWTNGNRKDVVNRLLKMNVVDAVETVVKMAPSLKPDDRATLVTLMMKNRA